MGSGSWSQSRAGWSTNVETRLERPTTTHGVFSDKETAILGLSSAGLLAVRVHWQEWRLSLVGWYPARERVFPVAVGIGKQAQC